MRTSVIFVILHTLGDCVKVKEVWLQLRVGTFDPLFFLVNWNHWLQINIKGKAKVGLADYEHVED